MTRTVGGQPEAGPSGGIIMKKSLALGALALLLMSGTALADTAQKKIAFSNNYAGNSWRQAMLKSYDLVTMKAVADGVVAAADVFTTADQEIPTQAAQLQNLILQGYAALVLVVGLLVVLFG